MHLVFNNAGVGAGGLLWENSLADWEWVLGVNLWGVIHGIRSFTPRMLEAARRDPGYHGHIVNTASVAGLLSPPNMGVYNVSKHAVVTLSETLYQDLQLTEPRIGVSVLCPAFVPTGIAHSHRNRPPELTNPEPATSSQRLAQEVALLADRIDVTEEITRLRAHMAEFSRLCNVDTVAGRQLDFLTQELNREVNTIGSKAQSSEVAARIVAMKAELERLREQIQNVE